MGGSAPKPPPPTAEEKAMERRTRKRLDEEIGLSERRLKAIVKQLREICERSDMTVEVDNFHADPIEERVFSRGQSTDEQRRL